MTRQHERDAALEAQEPIEEHEHQWEYLDSNTDICEFCGELRDNPSSDIVVAGGTL